MSEKILQPKAGRPVMPDGYGIPENNDDLLPWSFVEERMAAAHNYWIATATKTGRPAATPVWGVWVDGRLYFEGSQSTRRARNILQNPRIVVHLENAEQVVILEGRARIYPGAPERSVAEKVGAAYRRKYSEAGYSPTDDQWASGGLSVFEPEMALGWTQFPKDVTRWNLRSE